MIDVVWFISDSWWDQGWLTHLFARSLWHVPHSHEYVHRHGFDELPDEADGAVVIVPGRWSLEKVEEIQKHLDSLQWCLLIVTGDEEDVFQVDALTHPNMEVWTQTPMPHYDRGKRQAVPNFWPPECPAILKDLNVERDLDWFFAGQINNKPRQRLEEVVRVMERGEYLFTDTFGSGLPYPEYLEKTARAKVIPCPSGPFSVDCFRIWEALEAGCVPIVNARAPNVDKTGYWETVFSEVPFPIIEKWQGFPHVLQLILDDWVNLSNRCSAWWQGYKRTVAWRFEDALCRLVDRGHATAPDDDITVLVPTSPCSVHPSTEDLEQVVASVRERLPRAEILLMIDGVRPEQSDLKAQYQDYAHRVIRLAEHEWANVLPIYFESFAHQSGMTRKALEYVRTPTVLFVEHDTPLVGDIPFGPMIQAVTRGGADLIRLHHEASILTEHEHMMLDREPFELEGLPVKRTTQWSQRPHVASSAFYRRIMEQNFDESPSFIEDRMHGVVHSAWREYGPAGFDRYRLHTYTPDGNIKRSEHLATRGSDAKY